MCRFASEYGSFVDLSLLEFAERPRSPVRSRLVGYDVGATGDASAVATVDELEDGSYFVEDVAVMRKTPYQEQLAALKSLNQKFGWRAGYVDSVGIGGPMAEFAHRQVSALVRGFAWSAANKTPVHEHARALIFDRRLVFAERLRDLVVQDFANISRVVGESGQVKYVAGRSRAGHSDAASAVLLALWAAHDSPANAQAPVAYARFSPLGGWTPRFS